MLYNYFLIQFLNYYNIFYVIII